MSDVSPVHGAWTPDGETSPKITETAVIDAIWRGFNNQYWPAHYFIDAKGRIRHHHFGEGDYDGSERIIQQLLAEAGTTAVPGGRRRAARRSPGPR